MACGSGSGTPPMHLQLNAITRYFFLAKSLHAIELDLVEFNEQMQGNIKFLSFFGPNIKFLSQKQKEASSTQEERKKDPSAIFSHIKYVSLSQSSALSLLPTIKPSRSLCSQKEKTETPREKVEDYSHTRTQQFRALFLKFRRYSALLASKETFLQGTQKRKTRNIQVF